MNKKNLTKFSKKINSKFELDFDVKKLNWFNIGGLVKAFFKPNNLEDLILFLKTFGESEKIFILGAGSNILFTDKKFDGVVIKLGSNFSNISLLPNNVIVAGSAATDKKLSDFAMENCISGLEFLSCIPGTVGGGLKINSGCFGREFKDVLLSVQAIDRKGVIKTIPASKIEFGYRYSPLDKDLIFLSASFKGIKKDKLEIKKTIEFLKDEKKRRQPSQIKTGGSTFKNPIGKSELKVWEIIKNSISISKSFGDAKISEKHCNFFVNSNNANFDDMKKLITYVKKGVEDKTGIKLETEIEIIE